MIFFAPIIYISEKGSFRKAKVTVDIMKCPVCGTEHNEKICPSCGQRAAWDWNEIDKKNVEGVKRTSVNSKLRRNLGVIVFIAFVLLAFVLLFVDTSSDNEVKLPETEISEEL